MHDPALWASWYLWLLAVPALVIGTLIRDWLQGRNPARLPYHLSCVPRWPARNYIRLVSLAAWDAAVLFRLATAPSPLYLLPQPLLQLIQKSPLARL